MCFMRLPIYTLAYSKDAVLNRQPATFPLKTKSHSDFQCLCYQRLFLEQLLCIVIGAGNVPKIF